jgi:2-octaprenyl-6-methoxyphenol hydroxylase
MEKQRICIIGDGLSGLTSAIAINNLDNVEVHLISKKSKKVMDKRTTAISESNFKFLKDNISELNTRLFWPSKNIELFYETKNNKINFLNFNQNKNKLMYVYENDKFKNILLKEIKKKKIRTIEKNIKDLKQIKNYALIILCLGGNSFLYDRIIKGRSIKKDYKEVALIGYVKHKLRTVKTSQFFLKEGPLAILPFSKNYFSFVWSLNKDFYENNSKKINNLAKSKIKNILKIRHNIQITNTQSYPLKLNLKTKYFNKNILILGEGLHAMHPIAGQGFNLILRDIKKLQEILKYYSQLGISLKNSFALDDFYVQRKPENIIFSLGVDATHAFFKQNKYLDPFKEIILKNIGKNNVIKKISKIISNQGLSI